MSEPPTLADVEPIPHGATARRLEWPFLPPEVRRLVERRLGSRVVDAESRASGFTPGLASVLTGEGGSRVFVKAASRQAQRQIASSYAEEARMLRRLPVARLPAAPLLWTFEHDGWVVLGIEPVEGRPPARPWRTEELDACLGALVDVARVLEPAPAGLDLQPVHEALPQLLTGWDDVREVEPDLPHLEEAAALAARLPDLPDADRFVHGDARDDNFLIGPSGNAVLCDWNWPCLAPVWIDVVDLLVSAHGDGLDPEPWLASHPLTAGVSAEHIDVWLAAFTGFMLAGSYLPVPRTSPYLRRHGRWYGVAAYDWLARRRAW